MILWQNLNSVGQPQATPAICPSQPALIRSRYSSTEMRLSAAAAIQAIATASAEHNTLFMQFFISGLQLNITRLYYNSAALESVKLG